MAVSKAVVPILKGETAKTFLGTLNATSIKPYSQKDRERTDRFLKERAGKTKKHG